MQDYMRTSILDKGPNAQQLELNLKTLRSTRTKKFSYKKFYGNIPEYEKHLNDFG